MNAPPRSPTTRADEAEIRDLLARRTAAVATKDAAALVALFTTDALAFDFDPPLRHGPRRVRDPDAWDTWFMTWAGAIAVELRDLAVTVGGDVAFATALGRIRGARIDGERTDMWFRSTVGLRREGGSWRIAHEHNSVPFHMDGSFRAATGLEPDDDSGAAAPA
jgi:ketosteroid isomerase-like protein